MTEPLRPARPGAMLNLMNRYLPWLLLAPIIVQLVIFRYIPTFMAFWYSFTKWNGIKSAKFVGFKNYIDVLTDYVFIAGLRNTLIYTIIRLVLLMGFAFLAAELVVSFRSAAVRMFWKIVFIIPIVVPVSVVFRLWGFIFEPQAGLLNTALRAIGLDALATEWLGSSATALGAVSMIQFPFVGGLSFLIFVSALEGLSGDVSDACKVEGCGRLRRVFAVDLPMLKGSIIFVAVLIVLACLQTTEPQLILTGGGPGTATESPAYYVYRSAFKYSDFGVAAAAGVIMVILGLVFSFYSFRARYKQAYDVDL